jgi:hypothetical protein
MLPLPLPSMSLPPLLLHAPPEIVAGRGAWSVAIKCMVMDGRIHGEMKGL